MKKEKKEEKTVEDIFNSFSRKLDSIKSYFEKFGQLAATEDTESLKRFSDYLTSAFNEVGIDLEKGDSGKHKLTPAKARKLKKALTKQPKLTLENYNILSSSSFLILNNYLEYLLADLLTFHYVKFKDSLNEKSFHVSLKDLGEYDNVAELETALIYKEVESILLDLSFPELLEHFNKKLSIPLNEELIDWESIYEGRERRHLIVHNDSVVNRKYLTRTDNPDKLKRGDKVRVSKDYFQKSFLEYRLAGLLLSLNCWGKWDSSNADSAIALIMTESFEGRKRNELDYALRVTNFANEIQPRNETQEDFLLRIKFNKCIGLKKTENTEGLNKELKGIKVGTATPVFKLAHAILSDAGGDSILSHLQQALSLGEVELEHYEEWPIFEFIRGNDELDDKIRKLLTKSVKKASTSKRKPSPRLTKKNTTRAKKSATKKSKPKKK